MPPSRPKPSEIAAEAKRVYVPHIWKTCIGEQVTSYSYPDTSVIRISAERNSQFRTRVAVVEGDPVDYALGWSHHVYPNSAKRIPVVNMANEKRAGGDWESGLMAPEECFARRSNLVHALTMPWKTRTGQIENLYPIPQRGGIYTSQVCMFIPFPRPIIAYRTRDISRWTGPELRTLEGNELASCDICCARAETEAR